MVGRKEHYVANGTIVCFHGFLWSSPSTCLPFCLQPGGRRTANKMEGKWKVFLYLVAPPQAGGVYSVNSSFCWRTTFRNNCAFCLAMILPRPFERQKRDVF